MSGVHPNAQDMDGHSLRGIEAMLPDCRDDVPADPQLCLESDGLV